MPTTDVLLMIRFCCAACGGPVRATLRCEGDLASATGPFRVPLDCPFCRRTNDVAMGPDGTVHSNTARPRMPSSDLIWN